MELKYKSIFKEEINSMIMYEKAMNFKNNNKIELYDLDKYFIKINKKDKRITEKEFKDYIYNFEQSNISEYRRYLIILKFAKFLIRLGNTNIFFEEINFQKKNKYEPHIYTKQEMIKIIAKVDAKEYLKKEFQYMYPVLFRLLFSTGLRISEALNIRYIDVNLDDDSIDIILSKEDISRKIYLSNSMKVVLNKYLSLIKFNSEDLIFKTTSRNVLIVFKDVLKGLNIQVEKVRVHDIRHSFAVRAFEKMIKNNIEPEEALLYLEKYMGHSEISSTEYYLHMTDNMKKEIIDTMQKYAPDIYPKVKDGVCNE